MLFSMGGVSAFALARGLRAGELEKARGVVVGALGGSGGGGVTGAGQPHREGGAAAQLARHLDRSPVLEDDLLGQRQAQAGALLLGGEERVEDLRLVLGGDATAGVADAHRYAPAVAGCG